MIGKLKEHQSKLRRRFHRSRRQRRRLSRHCFRPHAAGIAGHRPGATLSIETHVREDQIRLFGFLSDVEREWFRLLQTVQGVGAKVALSVLSTLKAGDLASASRCATRPWWRARPAWGRRSPSASSPS